MAASDTTDAFSKGVEYLSNVENESEGYYGNLNLLANAPYQDEPCTVHGQPPGYGQISQVRQLVCVLKYFDKYIYVASYPCYIDLL